MKWNVLYIRPKTQNTVIEGKSFQAQTFERNRLELHPEYQPPYDVLLSRLGIDRLTQQGRDWFTFPKGQAQAGCRFFPAVGHMICGDILVAWHTNEYKSGPSHAQGLYPKQADSNGNVAWSWGEQ